MIVAIIPARAGSKKVPKKNIKPLGGYPLISYTIIAAKKSRKINRVIVSTDSGEIADIAELYGAEVPFLRPKRFATDKSTDLEFVSHFLTWFKREEGNIPYLLVHLRPTTPLREPLLIDQAIKHISENRIATSLRSVHEMPESPRKAFEIMGSYLKGLFPSFKGPGYYNLPRQSFPLAYHPNGYVDILRPNFITKNNDLHGSNILAFKTPFTVEVDQPEDFDYLQYIIEKKGHLLYDILESNHPKVEIQ